MTSPGLPDWDPLEVPVDEAAEPLDAQVGCSLDDVAPPTPRTPHAPAGTG